MTRTRRDARAPGKRLQRRVGNREPRESFLIVCEGTQSEPNYFEYYKRSGRLSNVIVELHGVGRDPLSVVQRAERLDKGGYTQIWCVFDRDESPTDRFQLALIRAGRIGYHVAYSNPAFELWLLLHFEYCQSALDRRDYPAKLTRHLDRPYAKNDALLFAQLRERQIAAIRHAEQLLAQYAPPNPAQDNPSTTVHLLVQQLNRFL